MTLPNINDKEFKSLIGGYGFEGYEPSVLPQFASSLTNILQKSMEQSGGRVSLPSVFFGNHHAGYASSPNGPVQDIVTDTVAQPGLSQTFPHRGGSHDASDTIFEKAFKSFRQNQSLSGGAKRVKKEKKETTKFAFKAALDNMFKDIRRVAKKTKVLTEKQIKRVTKKFA
jgi:hypothetical protein